LNSEPSSKEQALSMRALGITYKEISATTGLSVDWCKRNLKSVETTKREDPCLVELINAAIKPEGITNYEAGAIIFKYHQGANKEKVRSMKKKAKMLNPKCLFRPDWLDASSPTESYKAMNAYALHLMDEIDTLVRHYSDTFPSVRAASVKYELIKLSCSNMVGGEPLSTHVLRTERVAEELSQRT
jgi:hypothetical protein